jgi:hypothetical protein
MAVVVYSDAWGKLIHEKNQSRKSRDTVPLRQILDHFIRDWKEFKKKFHCLYLKKLFTTYLLKFFNGHKISRLGSRIQPDPI